MKIESVNLSANIPIQSHRDFTLSFAVVSENLNPENYDAIAEKLSEVLPGMVASNYGDNKGVMSLSISDSDNPGMCNHLVNMFQQGGVEVKAMGTVWQQPPHLADSPAPENLSAAYKDLESFQKAIEEALSAAVSAGKPMSWMIDNDDPARLQIVERAKALGLGDELDRPAHELGEIELQDGKKVHAHVVHAVDPIITDGDELVMINRMKDPGMGKPALPGGFLDPKEDGGVETPVQGAVREALEEAFEGVEVSLGEGSPIGKRNFDRPFDVRVAQGDGLKSNYGIGDGDIFMVSTQAVRFDFPELRNTPLVAGDDAVPGSARRVEIASLTKEGLGIPDHFDMIAETFPKKFTSRTDGQQWKDSLGDRGGRSIE